MNLSTPERLLRTWLLRTYWLKRGRALQLEEQIRTARRYEPGAALLDEHLGVTRSHVVALSRWLEPGTFATEPPEDLRSFASCGRDLLEMPELSDEVLSVFVCSAVVEQLEIAQLRVVVAAAESAQRHDLAEACGDLIRDDEYFADWHSQQIASLTRSAIHRAVRAEKAK